MAITKPNPPVRLTDGATDAQGDTVSVRSINGAIVTTSIRVPTSRGEVIISHPEGDISFDDKDDLTGHPLEGEVSAEASIDYTLSDGVAESPQKNVNISVRGANPSATTPAQVAQSLETLPQRAGYKGDTAPVLVNPANLPAGLSAGPSNTITMNDGCNLPDTKLLFRDLDLVIPNNVQSGFISNIEFERTTGAATNGANHMIDCYGGANNVVIEGVSFRDYQGAGGSNSSFRQRTATGGGVNGLVTLRDFASLHNTNDGIKTAGTALIQMGFVGGMSNVEDGDFILDGDPARPGLYSIPLYDPTKNYKVGDLVRNNRVHSGGGGGSWTYRCLQDHVGQAQPITGPVASNAFWKGEDPHGDLGNSGSGNGDQKWEEVAFFMDCRSSLLAANQRGWAMKTVNGMRAIPNTGLTAPFGRIELNRVASFGEALDGTNNPMDFGRNSASSYGPLVLDMVFVEANNGGYIGGSEASQASWIDVYEYPAITPLTQPT